MWTANETARTLRSERTTILSRWQDSARTQLSHVETSEFACDGAATQCADTLLAALITYFETDTNNPNQSTPNQSLSPYGSLQMFAPAQAQVQRCAQAAAMSLAWPDVRAFLNLLDVVVRATLVADGAGAATCDLATGCLAAFAALVADHRVQHLEQELATHREEAMVTQHLAGRFLANASHELRTPLTAVLGFAELLQEENYGPLNPEQETAVGHIENSAQNLLEIVNNLLDLLHYRAGKLVLQYRPVNLRSLLEHLYLILIPLASRKSVQFEMERGADLGSMEADENIVRHIVYYLLSSALRATPAEGRVTLRAWRGDERATIEVQDTALHLPPEAVANMLAPFPRLENSPARGYEGWEVGLPLVQRYVDLHHGTLEIESLPTQGTIFRVGLPLKRHMKSET
jgi:signal transduction histidine kinase